MAEVTGLRNNALPYPVRGVPYGIVVPILDADGDLVTGAAGLDSEVSKNGDTFADCTNEATEIATSSGFYYLLLTGTELTADVVTGITKTSTSGAKTTPWALYPKKLPTVRSGTAQGGATGSITLDSGASAVDGAYAGCLIVATIDSAVEARICTGYVGSTKVASVTPDWNVTPDADDTFVVYLPDGVQVPTANVTHLGGDSQSATDLKDFADAGYDPATNKIEGVKTADALTANNDKTGYDLNADQSAVTVGTVSTLTGHTPQTGDSYAIVSSGTHGNAALKTLIDAVKTVADAVQAKTDNLPSDPADQSLIIAATNALSALIGLPAGASLSADVAAVKDVADDILVDTAEIGTAGAGLTEAGGDGDHLTEAGGTGDQLTALATASALAAVGNDAGAAKTAAEANQTTIGVAGAGLTEAGGTGDHLTAINLPNQTMDITGNITGNLSGSVGSVTGAVGSVTGNVGGNVAGSVASVTAGVTLAASAVQAIWDALTSALTTAGSIGKLLVDNINATISSRLASASYTAPLDAAGIRSAVGLASANLDTQLDDIPTVAEFEARTLLAANYSTAAAVAALNNISTAEVLTQVETALTAAVADSVPADGSRPSIAQGVYLLTQFLLERSVSGTTLTVKKPDGSTTLITLTLNDATSPTSITRAS